MDKTTWNFRVVRDRWSEAMYTIHEVYYAKHADTGDEVITAWSQDHVAPIGNTVDELRWELEHMLRALGQPVLEPDPTTGMEKLRVVTEDDERGHGED